jgi:hypothetical protein
VQHQGYAISGNFALEFPPIGADVVKQFEPDARMSDEGRENFGGERHAFVFDAHRGHNRRMMGISGAERFLTLIRK